MTITVGSAATHNEKEVKRKYPVTSGLTAGTTKQEGRKPHLIAESGTFIARRKRVGIDVF